MRGKKAKAIAKIVFGDGPKTIREYVRMKVADGKIGPLVNSGDVETIKDGATGIVRKLSKRSIYQHLKSIAKGVPISKLRKAFQHENS